MTLPTVNIVPLCLLWFQMWQELCTLISKNPDQVCTCVYLHSEVDVSIRLKYHQINANIDIFM